MKVLVALNCQNPQYYYHYVCIDIQARLQGWGTEIAPNPILAPNFAPSQRSAPVSLNVPATLEVRYH